MLELLKKLFGYGCIHCGRAIHSKEEILCYRCEYRMMYHQPAASPGIISTVSYRTEQARSLILYMKEYYDPYVFDYAASLIEDKLCSLMPAEYLSDFYIAYAPRNPVTYLKKRFDQSREIADFLALRLFEKDSSKVISMFRRTPFAHEQKKLGASGRADNVKKLFKVKKGITIPEKLIIVDDVTTTGSTLRTLYGLALKAGVRECILCTVSVNDRKAAPRFK